MSRTAISALFLLGCLVNASLTGCVKRVYEAPGLTPGGALTVGSEMRVETFQVEQWEVRAFQIPITGSNKRRYQFAVLKHGIPDHDIMLEQMEDGVWALIENRPDGISITRKTYPQEPAYPTVRAEVIRILREGS